MNKRTPRRKGLLAVSTDAKTVKGETQGYLTGILYLTPANASGREVCIGRSAGCTLGCLHTSGRGAFDSVRESRQAKTEEFFTDSRAFVDTLVRDVAALVRKAARWERIRGTNVQTVIEQFPTVQFYDYTKRANRQTGFVNYHLTFSRSEANHAQCGVELEHGRNVAVVFDVKRGQPLPSHWWGYEVVDGDATDLRFLDAPAADGRGRVIGLRAKGRAKRDASGFVVRHREHIGGGN